MELTKSGLLPSYIKFDHLTTKKIEELADNTLSLLNLIGVDTNRDTHYQTKDEMELARKKLHKDVFSIDRGIYSAIFCLPGTIEFARQGAIKALLSNPWREETKSVLPVDSENDIIEKLLRELQPNKVLNMFIEMVDNKVNNSRTRRYMLNYILGSKSLELWAVKYRPKINKILTHCWGVRYKNIVKAILDKDNHVEKELNFLTEDIIKYIPSSMKVSDALQCVAFILGIKKDYSVRMLKAYNDAKTDLKKGSILPMDILDGIRSTYHPKVTQKELLNLTKKTMTTKQKKLVQNKAKKEGVAVTFDPRRHPMTDLYIYAYKMGASNDIKNAIKEKAKKASASLPFKYGRIGVVFDASYSMKGSDEQPMRPIAVASATTQMLKYACDDFNVEYSGGYISDGLVKPSGHTSLAKAFAKVLENEPDAVFIISDGYENTPAGRLDEVIQVVRRLGWNLPIYHINPVSAAEANTGVRVLSKDIPVMPISKPESVGLTFFKPMLEVDPMNGLKALLQMILPMLEEQRNIELKKFYNEVTK